MEEKINDSEITIEATNIVEQAVAEVAAEAAKKPEPSSEGQYIHSVIREKARHMDVFAAKNVYRSYAEIERARRRGDFKIEKTMTTDANGNIFFLCYDTDL